MVMNLTDNAIAISIRKKNERSAVLSVFTRNHGLYSGYVCTKKFCELQIGNVLHIDWSARLSNHLGRLRFELMESISALFLHNHKKMLALSSVAKILIRILPERDEKQKIYDAFYNLLHALKISDKWIINYINLELVMLRELGFELDLNKCPISNSSDNLAFISPKTGRAISYAVGVSYKDKLFRMPKTLYKINNRESVSDPENEFTDCLKITNYFLRKHFFSAYNIPFPIERELLYKEFVKKTRILC